MGQHFPAAEYSNLYVFGAGKAGAAMAVEVESALRETRFWSHLRGRVNVPASDAPLPSTARITLQIGRPAGSNFPTSVGHAATRDMLSDLASLDASTLAIGLISGGGSALLVAPRDGVELSQLLAVTRFLQADGATIHELNAVRGWLCQTKAGGLARVCTAGRIETLIISDVVGDDVSVIASGPCHANNTTAEDALRILTAFLDNSPGRVDRDVLAAREFLLGLTEAGATHAAVGDHVRNNLIATNALAVEAACDKARKLGYQVDSLGSTNTGDAYVGGRQFANYCEDLRALGGRWCVISGGEPTLVLNPNRPAGCRGGRNQAWALAALDELWSVRGFDLTNLAILAGGTDGEDGPCDVAGAIVTEETLEQARRCQLEPADFLDQNNEYAFFNEAGGHLDTGG
jgi:hydroxypyruvate reductase